MPFLYLKAPICFLSLILFLTLVSCSISETIRFEDVNDRVSGSVIENSFQVFEITPPPTIKSISLRRTNSAQGIAILTLNSTEQLELRFDEFGTRPQTHRIRFTHHNSDWSQSNLLPSFYQRGFSDDVITHIEPSQVQNPAYSHFRYSFPNNNIRLITSGNYMIHVHNFDSDELLFSLPFMIHEDRGNISFEIEELFGAQGPGLMQHQIFTRYHYPDFVTIPSSDLSVFYMQNHFPGRVRQADQIDMSEAGVFRSYISRDNLFPARYEFRGLFLNRIETDARNVLEFRPETIPPTVIMDRDVVNLTRNTLPGRSFRFGQPRDNTDARYLNVRFSLEMPRNEWDADTEIYVVGPFNNWSIQERYQMRWHADDARFYGNAIMKEGVYDYKYVVLENNRIDDLPLDNAFADSQQNYTALIYYHDPELQYDRLLRYFSFSSR